jgi:dihydrodipicolinate synthase/N-acetylneuraminate lyase
MKMKINLKKVWMVAVVILIVGLPVFVYSAPSATGTEMLDNLFKWLCFWVGRIGMIVAFFGAMQIALGFYRNDPDGKVMGVKTLASGIMVLSISASPHLFGM